MDNRLATLLTRGASLTRAEYRVLAHLTEHPLLVGNITVRELAKATFVSTATIMRLCQKLGFSGFSEFIWHCKQLLSDTPHIAAQAPSLPELPVLFNQFIANYQHTFQWVTQEKRQQFADLLRQTELDHIGCAIGSYPFFREGRVGANFVVRSTDPAVLEACCAALSTGLVAMGREAVPGGV